MFKTVVLLNIFEEMVIKIQDLLMNSNFKTTVFIKYKIINVFTITVDQFNASFMNKSIHLWRKTLLLPNFWTVVYF